MVSIGLTASPLSTANSQADIGLAAQSCNQSIRTARAAQPQKFHQKEEKGLAAEAAACKLFILLPVGFGHIGAQEAPQEINIGHLWCIMSARSQSRVKIGPNLN